MRKLKFYICKVLIFLLVKLNRKTMGLDYSKVQHVENLIRNEIKNYTGFSCNSVVLNNTYYPMVRMDIHTIEQKLTQIRLHFSIDNIIVEFERTTINDLNELKSLIDSIHSVMNSDKIKQDLLFIFNR